jgi:hypothetical protein
MPDVQREAVLMRRDGSRVVSDLYLAAALLATGTRLNGATRSAGRVGFNFEGSGELENTILRYANGTLDLNITTYIHALDRLRTLIKGT